MEREEVRNLLRQVADGSLSVEDAMLQLKTAPFAELGFATPDHHRSLRRGIGEVIYGAGKSAAQILEIARSLLAHGQRTVLITRLSPADAETIRGSLPLHYFTAGRIAVAGAFPQPDTSGKIVVATGGTSDLPVAEEAVITAQALGNPVTRLYDVGVAGLHRLLAHAEELMQARTVIAIAGMDGALASVIGGLVDCPVIAVPTSIGYGASFGGLSALLSMLNSCASGVGVVNIDNGFGAGYLASVINHMGVAQ